jgi:hypothetical protein
MRDGDLIFFSSYKFGAWCIRKYSEIVEKKKPSFDHVGMVRIEFERVKIFEAVWPRSREIMLSHKLKELKGKSVFCRVSTGQTAMDDDDIRKKAVRLAVSMSGLPYERISELTTAFVANQFRKISNNERYYCSEYVNKVWSMAGFQLANNNASPSALYHAPTVQPVCYLRYDE